MPAPLLMGYTLATFLSVILPQLAWVVLKALGVGALVFTGLNLLQTQLLDYFLGHLSDLNTVAPTLYAMYGLLNIDVLVNGFLSAFSVFLTIRGMCSSGKMSQIKLGLPVC